MIVVDKLKVALDGRPIIDGLDFQVETNEKVVISGESGSGKSTFLRTLIGRHLPKEGTIKIAGHPLTAQRIQAIRSSLFYLPQEIASLGDETVTDFLKIPFGFGVNRTVHFNLKKADELFEVLGLKPHLMTARLAELSGGERKRVGLVQGLLLNRPLMLLDELTSSVDRENRERLVHLVLSLKNVTVLAIAHDAYFMQQATRHVTFQNGRIETGA